MWGGCLSASWERAGGRRGAGGITWLVCVVAGCGSGIGLRSGMDSGRVQYVIRLARIDAYPVSATQFDEYGIFNFTSQPSQSKL